MLSVLVRWVRESLVLSSHLVKSMDRTLSSFKRNQVAVHHYRHKKRWMGGAKSINVGKMQPGKTGEADTKIKGKTFTYG